jgi:hypothetical protein
MNGRWIVRKRPALINRWLVSTPSGYPWRAFRTWAEAQREAHAIAVEIARGRHYGDVAYSRWVAER